jgi:antitoxin VapB
MITLPDEIEALARRLANARNLTVEDAVRQAVEAHARAAGLLPASGQRRDPSPDAAAARRARIDQIVHEIAALPVLDPRSPQEIMDDLNDL